MAKSSRSASKAEARSERKPHHTILWLEVTGGFLKGARLEFGDGLNCVIGGRGTGKTTVLEMVRYVLGLMPDEKAAPARARALRGLIQNNLGGGRVRIGVRNKHGMVYLAERPWNDSAQVYNQQGEATAITLDREAIFKADVYSQNEIEEIATNTDLQLALIDKFIEEDIRRVDAEIRKLQRDLDDNAAELLRLDRGMRDLRDTAVDLPVLEEKLKALQATAGPDAKLLNAAHAQRALREKERKTAEGVRDDLAKVRTDLESTAAALARRLESRIDADVGAGPNSDLFSAIDQHLRSLIDVLEGARTQVVQQTDAAERVLEQQQRALADRHAKQDGEYRALVAKSQEESGRATERSQLQERYSDVTTAGKELELRKKERRAREEQRQDLTARLSSLRNERFHLRKKVADRLSKALHPAIRVSVSQAGNRDGYRALLSEALKGQSMKQTAVAEGIVQGASPEELSILVQRNDATRLAERTGLAPERCKKVVDALRDTDFLYRLETVEVGDLPRIELLDGRDYKESADLSTGQRCTTILPVLLLESERPLLVDQPEDNLDNAFIYETVVKSLKGAKGRRQLIFVTHNPNIPVLGDAERVFVLTSDGKQGKLSHAGSVDELKGEIELLLEGGPEAFLLRKERYGH
jgi:energy-coupling factor transporter ATP-binding protein EcfA2